MENPWNNLSLPRPILQQLKALKFHSPTSVQQKIIPHVLKGESLSVISPPGSGKTLTFLIPIWVFSKQKKFRALIIIPTRELAYQISKVYQSLVPHSRDSIRLITGGKSTTKGSAKSPAKDRSFEQSPIILATPGRLIEHISHYPSFLKGVDILVLDEYDKLLALGFEEQILEIIEHLNSKTQRVGFSATPIDSQLSQEFFRNKNAIIIDDKSTKRHILESLYYLKTPKTKNKLCKEALKNNSGQTIIFVKNAAKANHLKGYLNLHNILCETLHGKLTQKNRSKIYQKFMDKKIPVLVATDLASRGLDTLKVDSVINFDLPQNSDIYIHRIGRSGRSAQQSTVVNFAAPEDYIPLKKIEKGLGRIIPADKNFNQRETWLKAARFKHQQKVQRENRLKEIKTKQGLIS